MATGVPLLSGFPYAFATESEVFFVPPAQRVVLRDRFDGTKEELARLRREAIDIRERLAHQNEGGNYRFVNVDFCQYKPSVERYCFSRMKCS